MKRKSTWENPTKPMPRDKAYIDELEKYIESNRHSNIEMFKKILDVEGIIIEAGVYHGGGLMAWAQLSAILEPYNHQRRVIGFDTFEGFASLASEDGPENAKFKKVGAWSSASYNDLLHCSQIHDITRPMGQVPKVHLVCGDVMKTAEQFIKENPRTVVSLLYLDVDLYEPTKKMLEVFALRVVKGGIIAFDQINTQAFSGETLAVEKILGIRNLGIRRFPFGTSITYAVV